MTSRRNECRARESTDLVCRAVGSRTDRETRRGIIRHPMHDLSRPAQGSRSCRHRANHRMPQVPQLCRSDGAARLAVARQSCFARCRAAPGRLRWRFVSPSTGQPAAAVLKSTALNPTVPGSPASNGPPANAAAARSTTPPPLPKKTGSSVAGISSGFVKPNQGSAAPSAGRSAAAIGAWAPSADRPANVGASAATEHAAEVVGSNHLAASSGTSLVGRYLWWLVGSAVAIAAVASVAWVLFRSHGVAPPPTKRPLSIERRSQRP